MKLMVIHDQNDDDVIEPTEPLELPEGHHMVDVLLPEVGYFLLFSVEWDYRSSRCIRSPFVSWDWNFSNTLAFQY